jgi:site-specific DNA-methyltransferase (adenine-specific)
MDNINTILNMDCVSGMKTLPDNSIDLTVTSPPYDNLRTYNGYSFKFEETANELFRITKEGGVVVWVVGDSTIKGSESGTSFRQALYFKDIGFNLHDTMIFQKKNPIPQNHNRYEQCFEYMFVFSKGKPKTFNPIRVETKNGGKAFDWGKRNKLDDGQCRRHREDSEVIICNKTKIHNNIFEYSIGGQVVGHPATFPEKLAQDHILSWSNENDIVLDPFMGSGTTAKMALLNNRKYVGFEISKEYCELANKRLNTIDIFKNI